METYIRFQTPVRCAETGRPLGIFGSAGRVGESHDLPDVTRDWLRGTLKWFNDNLTVPQLNAGEWRSVFWFRAEAQPVVAQIWELVAILRDEGVPVYMQRTNEPGQIVYEDNFQIAAVPNGLRRRKRWVA